VVGSRFGPDLLTVLGVEPVVDGLVAAELIDQVRFTPHPEYVFHHPLIRTVAYESQLKSDRLELHRRLADAIKERYPESVEENAALIAEHLEAAGDLRAAYDWHMRAAGWSSNRDIAAARVSWQRARQITDALPDSDSDRTAMRIAPTTMLCATGWRVHSDISARFDELRDLCMEAGDKTSLAIGMAGLVPQHFNHGRLREASQVGTELMALVESIGDPTLTVGLASSLPTTKFATAEMGEVLRWSQTIIDLAQGDPAKGNFIIGSPLAVALALRGTARYAFGTPGWRDDLDLALATARGTDPWSFSLVSMFAYAGGIQNGALLADDTALRDIEEALRIAERSSDDVALNTTRLTLGAALMHRDSPADRERGSAVLQQLRDACLNGQFYLTMLPALDWYLGRERARRGDRDGALPVMHRAVDDLYLSGQIVHWDAATGALVETLLERPREDDVAKAQAAIARLAALQSDEGLVIREVWLTRLNALLAQARGDDKGYRHHRDRYRAMATSLGFEGHIKWADAMP